MDQNDDKSPASPKAMAEFALRLSNCSTLARANSVRNVNAIMTATYWEIGRRIVEFEQRGEKRADYGEELIRRLADDLVPRFGRGFGWRN